MIRTTGAISSPTAKTHRGRSLLSRRAVTAVSVALVGLAACASTASADFGIKAFDAGNLAASGSTYTQAGGHPHESYTALDLNTHTTEGGWQAPDAPVKDVVAELPLGVVGNTTAIGQCKAADLLVEDVDKGIECPVSSLVGTSQINLGGFTLPPLPLWNMETSGLPTRWAFEILGVIVFYDAELRASDYGVNITVSNTANGVPFGGNKVDIWGTPAASAHDEERCTLIELVSPGHLPSPCPGGKLKAGIPALPYVTMPTRCKGADQGLEFAVSINSWEDPLTYVRGSVFTHAPPFYPAPESSWGAQQGTIGCDVVPFTPDIAVAPSTQQAETPTGLSVQLDIPPDGLLNPSGIAQAHMKKATVTLPRGVTINPSAAEGLGVCTPEDFAEEALHSAPTAGCPDSSKIGSISIDTPLLDQDIEGTLHIAKQDDPSTSTPGAENPFDSLLALYIIARNTERGIFFKLPGKVDPDPDTGQLVTTFDDLPQLPFAKFNLKFREGVRAALVTPPACGTYTTEADFVPWSAVDPDNPTPSEIRHTTSSFEITGGIGGGPCPPGGLPPFRPGLKAGTLNNNAGSFSPFNLRLSRNDGEQEFTHFSIKLPPGVIGKLAGIPFCPDAAIEAAKSRTGSEELASPACPVASEVGRTLVGAGVGSVLTYAPGKLYLAGPYNGSAVSIVSITAGRVGPFDLGTVVVRQALRINPETAEVFIDATGSDPIPHIIDGITVHLRDIRAYVDRPDFVLNPTSCDPTSTASTVLGSGLDFSSPADDEPVTVSTRFQAASCLNLGFKPRLGLRLFGKTRRGGNPKFRAVLRMKPGEANIAKAQVTLPRSAFLDQSHIGTVCTRVQYAADQCPTESVYGYARAWTPLLDTPIEGPVYLRSSSNKLPDLVAALKNGQIEIDLVGRVSSFGKGRIRNTFESVPDAPVSTFVLTMRGGNKGLIQNSADLCRGKHRALIAFDAHNGKIADSRIPVRAQCGKKKQKRAKRAGHSRRAG